MWCSAVDPFAERTVPSYLGRETLCRFHLGVIAKVLASLRDIRARVSLISALFHTIFDAWLHADAMRDRVNRLAKGDASAPTDVVDLSERAAFERTKGPVDTVRDEGDRSRLKPVAIKVHRTVVEHCLDEDVVRHIWSLARTVDREIAQDQRRQAEGVHVGHDQVLSRELGHPIRGTWSCRNALVPDCLAAIDRGGRDLYKPCQVCLSRCIKKPAQGNHVTAGIQIQVIPASDHSCDSRLIDNCITAFK
jgi:hypothetical protein